MEVFLHHKASRDNELCSSTRRVMGRCPVPRHEVKGYTIVHNQQIELCKNKIFETLTSHISVIIFKASKCEQCVP